ncbi:CHAT domain-containing protein [Lentzea sp. CA-135723]|uniref:CHAT domain-containing protein n=1 Tax=Lentzea sp. CA-135723 TaxID=3239950 RepID=UPI003D8CF077
MTIAVTAASAGWQVVVHCDGLLEEFDLKKVELGPGSHPVPTRTDPPPDLEDLIRRIDGHKPYPDDIQRYGHWLFSCVLAPVWDRILSLPQVVEARGVELALTWAAKDTSLNQLVWEAMHDDAGTPLASHPDLLVATTRVVPVKGQSAPETITGTPRVLFAIGSSLTDDIIRPGAMFMGLLRRFDADGICVVKIVENVSDIELASVCEQFSPDVVHLVAHGDVVGGRGVVMLAGKQKNADSLRKALITHRGRPLAVVLSACRSGQAPNSSGDPVNAASLAAELVQAGIPIVSAMAGDVSEPACRFYTRHLVDALHEGMPIAAAAASGRRAALQDSCASTRIDWAMPSLFVASTVQRNFQPINPALSKTLVRLATQLDLRRPPVFIGRQKILNLLDRLFEEDERRRLGVIGAVREGELKRIGSTRLLREIGFQVLRRGHLPLLLGPFANDEHPPHLRAALSLLYKRAIGFARLLEVPFRSLSIVSADSERTAPDLTNLDRELSWQVAQDQLAAFSTGIEDLDVMRVASRLANDLAVFARVAGRHQKPFGPHSRPVVLADSIHSWGALGDVLRLLHEGNPNGLGSPAMTAPVVFTAAFGSAEGDGRQVRKFVEERRGDTTYQFPWLDRMSKLEASMGFQWILLNPWQLDEPDELMAKVYAALPGVDPADLHDGFDVLDGIPTEVEGRLYPLAHYMTRAKHMIANNDEVAWQRYVERYPR